MSMITNLEKMLAKGQDSSMLRFGLGNAYLNEGEPQKAIEHLEQCIAQQDDYTAAYKLLGKAYQAVGEHSQAKSTWEAGIAIAKAEGDIQAEREMTVFLKKLAR